MLRKFALVIVAVSALGVAALTPTPASAWRGGWYGGGGWGGGGGLGRWLGSARRMGPRLASWLGTWLGMGTGMAFRLGMERTTLRRGARILWRMRRPAVGARPMGTAQDSRQQVLMRSAPPA